MQIRPQTALPLDTRPQSLEPGAGSKLHVQAERAAGQFETLMALQLVRTMQSSLDGGSLLGDSTAGNMYGGLAEWELAQLLARHADFGLKEQILRQLPEQERGES